MSIISKIFGDQNKKTINSLVPIITEINKLEPEFEHFSIEELKSKTSDLKKELLADKSLDDILPEAFALVREAAKRTLHQRHYDAQLMGGIILHRGKIAEMHTGEGKTLVATLPAYLNALTGKGVHIVTVNDYLSRRDVAWMGQIYNILGLTVACINHEASYVYDTTHISKEDDDVRDETGSFKVVHEFLRPVTRREAYEADITYGTNNEYGFDYLRDNMAYDILNIAQAQGHNYAIVDEVDSILIDESRTPLIISAPDTDSNKLYDTFSKIVPRLAENEDYNIDEKLRTATITEEGIEKVEKILGIGNIYNEGGTRYVHHLEQALRAHTLYKRDKDYVVKDGEVIIVDEFTGRMMPGRRWSEGLHQAIEAKEGVAVQKESRTLATITFQNYFRLYGKLAGMTGTAQTSAEEFHKVYKLDVVTIPTHRPLARKDHPDRIYKTETGKLKAVAKEIKERYLTGQPVLVGTVSITKNEILSHYLNNEGVPHKVLNAKNHEQEGEIIAQAGKLGRITVATNMAGRGVDIILGGNPSNKEEARQVTELGGLHVIGTERHEARRIDNQLRGRAGRQGDPGSSQFFVSTQDEVIRIFGGDRLQNLMERLGVAEEEAIENSFISRAIEQAQSKIEGHNFDMRNHVLEYDDVMNRHRTAIYHLRREILELENVKEKIIIYINKVVDDMIGLHLANANAGDGIKFGIRGTDVKELADNLNTMVTGSSDVHTKLAELAEANDYGNFNKFIFDFIDKSYEQREHELGNETMRNLEKALMLRVIDELWVDHLESMEHLRDSVRLRAYGQRDPLIEYKIEGQKMFIELQNSIGVQIANLIFKVSLIQYPSHTKAIEGRYEQKSNISDNMADQASSRDNETIKKDEHDMGRNDPCWCGSGKKYKKCHGK